MGFYPHLQKISFKLMNQEYFEFIERLRNCGRVDDFEPLSSFLRYLIYLIEEI
mgnify:CR=1 FL=1